MHGLLVSEVTIVGTQNSANDSQSQGTLRSITLLTRAMKQVVSGMWRALTMRLSIIFALVAALVVTVLAVINPGISEARTDLNEGGVWVSDTSRGLIGHLNYSARTLETGLDIGANDFTLLQHERDVVVTDKQSSSVASVDIAQGALNTASTLDFPAITAQGGEHLAVLDTETGRLWLTEAAAAGTTPYVDDTALEPKFPDGVLALSTSGTLFALNPATATLFTIHPEGAGYSTSSRVLPSLAAGDHLSLTVVGETPVVVDHSAGIVHLPGGEAELPDEDVVVQQPGPQAPYVVFATATSLYRMKLGSGEVTSLRVGGSTAPGHPAAPAVLGSCAYGAWGGNGNYLRWCDDELNTETLTVDTLAQANTEDLVFRVNRDVIVLNDTGHGTIWLPNDKMVFVDNWDEIEADLKPDVDEQDSPQTTDEVVDPDRTGPNKPPVANDDTFGARPGHSTLLPVLLNDSDADGDLLTASVVEPQPGIDVRQSRGGAALQVEIPDNAAGTFHIPYQAADGRGGTDTATITLTVRAPGENQAPEQRRSPRVVLGAGATVEYNVMSDWVDPEGDMFYLDSVSAPEGIQVQFQQEGTLRITDLGAAPGIKPIPLTMSDGTDTREGMLHVDVRGAENAPPVAHGDFLVVREGETATVSPLANDVDPNGDQLSLISVSPSAPGTTVTPAPETDTFDFRATAKGSYYLNYTVTDGPSSTTGVVRIDVVAAETNEAPVVQDDLVLLPNGGAALAGVLSNDFDPSGGVLVLQSVNVPDSAPMHVALIDHHLLRFTSVTTFTEPLTLTYTASNGNHAAQAQVLVVPTGERDHNAPPQPQDDQLRVRVGDVGSVPVLDNDTSVNGLPLRVRTDLQHSVPEPAGKPFVTGNEVRFRAGNTPGTHLVTYTVEDDAGNIASATVTVEIIDAAEGTNSAPRPKDLVSWSVAGQTVRIPVPLTRIDHDGDSVSLAGLQQAPKWGTVDAGPGWFDYTPATNASGTDTFTYLVEDSFGKQAQARVRVGITPRAQLNTPPALVPDTVLTRPMRQVSIDVLANDADPEGDALRILPDSLTTTADHADLIELGDRIITVHTPAEADTITASYQVSDGRGGVSSGLMTVHVDPNTPLRAPMPFDDIVTQQEIDSAKDATVRVNVLDNDLDPDGDRNNLILTTDEPNVDVSGQQLVIPITDTRRQVVYGVRDEDGLEGYAVVAVPGRRVEKPRVNATAVPLILRGGETRTLDVAKLVQVRQGRAARIVSEASVAAAPGLQVQGVDLASGTIVVAARGDFTGNTSVTFTAADGDVETDDSALTAGIVIPITVESDENQPPVFRPSPVTVAPAEPPVTANVCEMVDDPDGTPAEQLTYRLTKTPPALDVSLNNCTLSLSLSEVESYGPLGTITVAVNDGMGEVAGEIPVSVRASTRPLVQVSDAVLPNSRPGKTEAVDISGYIINPFPDKPVTIIGSPQIVRGTGTVDASGTKVEITPAADMLGTMLVSYTLADATGDPSRQVQGRIQLTIRDKPAPPTNVHATAVGPGSAMVEFTPGANNGAQIDSFTVTARSGLTTTCNTTQCLVTGLSNGTQHEFQVTATNEVGTSEASGWSAPVLVDVAPEQPAPPQVTPGDRAIEVQVLPTVSQGSAVTSYEVTLHPGDRRLTVDASGDLLATFSDLHNGTAYRVSVQAFNSAQKPSPSSELSAEAVPFGRPAAVASTEIAPGDGGASDTGTVTVSWQAGDGNGRPISGFTVNLSRDGDPMTQKKVAADVSSVQFVVPLGSEYSASVIETTEFGDSPATNTHSIRLLGVPNPPNVQHASLMVEVGAVVLRGVQTAGGGGFTDAEITVEVQDAAGTWQPYHDGMRLEGYEPGTYVAVNVRATATNGDVRVTSDHAQLNSTETFYTKPGQVGLTPVPTANGVTVTVDRQQAERGRPIDRVTAREQGAWSEQQVRATSFEVSLRAGEQKTIEVQACAGADCGDWASIHVQRKAEFEVTDLPGCDARSDGMCTRLAFTYHDAAHERQQLTCTFTPPDASAATPAQPVQGVEGRRIITPWEVRGYHDPRALNEALNTGKVRVDCSPR